MSRIVLITGASRGIGLAIAQKFLANQDFVYATCHFDKNNYEKLTQEYSNLKIINCDVTNEDDIKNLIKQIKLEVGHLDILVNNAAIAIDTPLELKEVANFQKILNTNLIGPFLISKYAQEIMPKGSIINIASTNGIDTYYPYSLDYDASKAALISLTHNLAVSFAPNIRVNAIAAGWVNTSMNQNLTEDFIQKEEAKILLQRFANPSEIAEVVFFLASDAASFITSSIIRVDGGYYAR